MSKFRSRQEKHEHRMRQEAARREQRMKDKEELADCRKNHKNEIMGITASIPSNLGTQASRNKEAANKEAELHPDWWNLKTIVAKNAVGTDKEQIIVRMVMPPFDTFAFDRVSAVLNVFGFKGKYDGSVCDIPLDKYQQLFPYLEQRGLRAKGYDQHSREFTHGIIDDDFDNHHTTEQKL